MHAVNYLFLTRCAAVFNEVVRDGDILEIGSNIDFQGKTASGGAWDPNGVVRSIFAPRAKNYKGIDLVAGPGVDYVGDAADYKFADARFDVVLNISVMEHTPRWPEIIRNTLPLVRPKGIYIISCGSENNTKHPPEPWAIVPSNRLLQTILQHSTEFVLLHAGFEEYDNPMTDTSGCFDVVLRRGVRRSG